MQKFLGWAPKPPDNFYYKDPKNNYHKFVNAYCKMEIAKDISKKNKKEELGLKANKAWKRFSDLPSSDQVTEILRIKNKQPGSSIIVPFEQLNPPQIISQPSSSSSDILPPSKLNELPANATVQKPLQELVETLLLENHSLKMALPGIRVKKSFSDK
jgi:hypothetical protein